MPYGLPDIMRDLTAVVDQFEADADRVREAEPLVGQLIAEPSWLPPESRTPATTGYARHSLYVDPLDRFEILALVWQPGQRTPIHDHDATWGVEGVLTGRIRATNFLQRGEGGDGSVGLHELGQVVLDGGSTGRLLPPADCHILETEGEQLTVTIHVYGKRLRRFKVFHPTERPGFYRVGICEVAYAR